MISVYLTTRLKSGTIIKNRPFNIIASDLSQTKYRNITFQAIILCLIVFHGFSQPNLSTRKLIENTEIFQDYKDKKLYYFVPQKLILAKEPNGKPKFSLLSMRYTGSTSTSNSGEKRFLNLVQFTIQLQSPSTENLKIIKQQLGGNVSLKPCPIRSIENQLVASFNDSTKPQTLASSAGLQDDKSTSSDAYWTERSMTFRLDNNDAQLLIEQIDKKQITLSLNYAFFADCISGLDGTARASGTNKTLAKELEKTTTEMAKDTVIKTQAVFVDALQFQLDNSLVRKIDLNEEVPPAYALLEVRCYDFINNLRPDLFMKTIDIQAVGVNGQTVTLPAKRFIKNKTDVASIQVQFPYAVRMYQPLKYRITEYFMDGKRVEGDWISRNSFTELIDITTPIDSNKITQKSIEIEVDREEFSKQNISEVKVEFTYQINQKAKNTVISFKESNLSNQNLNLIFDKTQPLEYKVSIQMKDGSTAFIPPKTLTEDYIFLNL